jgi:hypothetical protein
MDWQSFCQSNSEADIFQLELLIKQVVNFFYYIFSGEDTFFELNGF